MTTLAKPARRPKNPRFSSGPCAKHPGWSLDGLRGALLGRNHRAPETKARLALALERTRELLELPAGYVAAIVLTGLGGHHFPLARFAGWPLRREAEHNLLRTVVPGWRRQDSTERARVAGLLS